MTTGVLFFISTVAGLIGAISGIGGGIVLIPALTIFGINIKRAIALSVLSMLAISNTAAATYVKRHLPSLKVVAWLEAFAVIGAVIGSLLTVVSAPDVLFVGCGGMFLIFSILLWRRGHVDWQAMVSQDAYSHQLGWSGSYYDEVEGRTLTYRGTHAALAGPLMCGAAALAGLLGMGGSALSVLINDGVIGLPPKVSLTTSSLVIGVMALVSSDVYLEAGLFDPRLVAPTLLGVIIGALIGSRLITKLTNRTVLRILCGMLVALGLELIVRGVS